MKRKRLWGVLIFILLVLVAGLHAVLEQPQTLGTFPLALAVDQRDGSGFVANYGSGTVSMLDAASGAVRRTIAVRDHPVAVAVDEQAARVAIISQGATGSTGTLTLLDARTGTVLHTVPVGIAPTTVAFDERTGQAFVLNLGSATLLAIDVRTGSVQWTVRLSLSIPSLVEHPACTGMNMLNVCFAEGMAGRLLELNANRWYSAQQSPQGLVVDARRDHVFVVATMRNAVFEFAVHTGALLHVFRVGKAPCALVIDPRSGRGFVSNLDSNSISILDTIHMRVLKTVPVGQAPCLMTLDTPARRLFVANQSSSTLDMMDVDHDVVAQTTIVGYGISDLALDGRTHHLFLATLSADAGISTFPRRPPAVWVLDSRTGSVLRTLETSRDPVALAVDSETHSALVLHAEQPLDTPRQGWPAWLERWIPFLPASQASSGCGDCGVVTIAR